MEAQSNVLIPRCPHTSSSAINLCNIYACCRKPNIPAEYSLYMIIADQKMNSDLYENYRALSVALTPQSSDTIYLGNFSEPGVTVVRIIISESS